VEATANLKKIGCPKGGGYLHPIFIVRLICTRRFVLKLGVLENNLREEYLECNFSGNRASSHPIFKY